MIASCEPVKLVVLCHIVYVKLTGHEGKINGKYAGKQQKGRTPLWFCQALPGLTTSSCQGVVTACV